MQPKKPYLKPVTNREEYVKTFYHIRKLEGWSTSKIDGDLYISQAKGKGYWAGFIDDEPFCIFSFTEYPDINSAFFGSYITKKEFRGKGLTFPLFKEKYDELKSKGYKFILTTADDMVDSYAKSMGVHPTGKIELLHVNSGDFRVKSMPKTCVVKASEIPLKMLQDYDREICRYDRSISVELFRSHPELDCSVFFEDGKIKGYCVLKRNKKGFKIAPLLADNVEIAQTLLENALEKVDKEEWVYIHCPHAERIAELKDMGFQVFFTVNIIGEHPNNFEKIYGAYAVDVGL